MAVQLPAQWRVLELHMPEPLSPLSRPIPLARSAPRVTLALTIPFASTRPFTMVPESPELDFTTPLSTLTGYRYPGRPHTGTFLNHYSDTPCPIELSGWRWRPAKHEHAHRVQKKGRCFITGKSHQMRWMRRCDGCDGCDGCDQPPGDG